MSEIITIHSNSPYKLHESDQLFKVTKGHLNIFAVLKSGKKEFLFSIESSEVFFSLENLRDEELMLEASAGTVHSNISVVSFDEITREELQNSVKRFSNYLISDIEGLNTVKTSKELFSFLSVLFIDVKNEIKKNLSLKRAEETTSLNNKIVSNQALTKRAIINLASIFDQSLAEEENLDDEVLIATVHKICKYLEIDTKYIDKDLIGEDDPIADISRILNIRVRQVNLEAGWYNEDNGALLGFTKDMEPIALLPKGTKSYFMLKLNTNTKVTVSKENVSAILTKAYMFYRPLPQKALDLHDILKFISFSNKKDFLVIFLVGLIGGLIALVSPLAIGKLYDEIIPESQRVEIFEILLALLVAAVSASLFQLLRGFATARVKSKMSLSLESAVWDRLINLPVNFFRGYSTGDLAQRANGINQIQQTLSGTIMSSILSGVFSIFSFLLLFKYSLELALIALGLVVVSVVTNMLFMFVQIKYQEKIIKLSGELSGFLLELISGVQKLKIANATTRAYAKWAEKYAHQRNLSYRAGFLSNYLQVFNTVFPLVVSIVIFSAIAFALKEEKSFSTGEFIAFNAAFGQFLSASLALSSAFLSVLSIKPIYERIKPIFNEIPEIQVHKKNPGKLDGNIELHNVSFKYSVDGVKILTDLNMTVNKGEFIAIVGSSGSGKSTLLRLLLGFEEPTQGNIFYNNQNLQDIDIRSVRSQLGVVLQNGQVMAGDIFTNIVGSTSKTIEDAWMAARMAGFDKDIEQMPMSMHTIVSEGGSTLSGGQRQRLLIARALISNPKIILFDEATSALDNITQDIVSKSLDALDATRIVIAHRLSTIINADRIFVLEHGEMTQSGTYDELMQEEGLFKELALRQIA